MLVLAVLQFGFVAMDAAGVVHGMDGSESHHEHLLNDELVKSHAGDPAHVIDLATENCDHCQHCHGHGSLMILVSRGDFLPTHYSSVQTLSAAPGLRSIFIHSIHRPPIA